MKKFYITTPIFYPSGKPHLGHAFSTLYASLLKDYKKLLGYDAYFLTGTDEHGQKIEEVAKKNNVSPQEFVDQVSVVFKDLWNVMGIKYDRFLRTTETQHKEVVAKTFDKLHEKGYIYLSNWKGLYCVSCEENYTETNAIKNEKNNLCCIHGHELKERNEESYFLKVSLFNDWIIEYLKNNKDFIFPENRAKELINNFLIDNKLEDLSITRTTFDWGIKSHINNKHVIYVWLDALLNYITALGYDSNDETNYLKYWNDDNSIKVHLLGKEITRFHCIYWPIILKMLDLKLPNKIISHGWIITETGKMSKSLGNVVNPIDVINKYGRDAFRYFLAKEISLKEDSVFSEERFIRTFNADLANNYGNLISRTIGMVKKYNSNIIPEFVKPTKEKDIFILESRKEIINQIKDNIESLNIKLLIENVVEFENKLNLYIEETKPWELKKSNNQKDLNIFLSILANSIRVILFALQPILIDATSKALKQLNFDQSFISLEEINNLEIINNINVNDSETLFSRIIVSEN